MEKESESDASCGRCARLVPPDQMESRFDELIEETAPDGPSAPGWAMMADTAHNMLSAIEAWQCDRCSIWICNGCILQFVTVSRARKMRHQSCGGVFKAPDAPDWIGVLGQRAVPTGSWRAKFGIRTFH